MDTTAESIDIDCDVSRHMHVKLNLTNKLRNRGFRFHVTDIYTSIIDTLPSSWPRAKIHRFLKTNTEWMEIRHIELILKSYFEKVSIYLFIYLKLIKLD